MSKENHQAGAWAVIYCSATGKFLMGKRSSRAHKSGVWNLFGGRVDRDERPKEALVRELNEEAGLRIKARHLTKLRTVCPRLQSGQLERDMHYFVIEAAREFTPRLNREHSDFRWFKAKQLPSKFNQPTLLAIKQGLLEKVARR
ncbi:MAG TPA: NUDIX hydrolase [Rhodocyclaceae bacterium]|nr:NUDIX hydrolase [Rhodocyclaceae bacterium]